MQINDLVQRLNAKQTGNNQYAAHCPAHDDKTPSLSIATGDDGRILLHCQAGCPLENIIWALGITSQDLFPSKSELSKLEAEYIYFDDQGNEILKKGKIRKSTGEKTFFWEHKENDGWVKGMNNIVPPLYNQNALKTGQAAVFIVEGEKDVDTLKKLGIIAVSSPHGAGNGKNKWLPEYSQKLKGFDVIILQDNDKPGKEFAKDVALNLLDIAKSVKVIDLTNTWSGLKEHGDISDVFELESEKQTVIAKLKKLVTDTPLFIKIEPDKKSVEKLSVISAIDLQNKDLPPLRFIVNGMLAQGLALLVSPPKFGKSWMSLDLCLSVAAGKPFLNHNTQKGSVLYLALEDSERRLQDRMNKLLCGKTAPAGFNYSTKSKDTANGLIDQIETYLEEYPETSLIVIDTLQKIRGPANGKDSARNLYFIDTSHAQSQI
jgi:5S rRNA maturation endonuclease (ribonuclease M5)